MTKPTHLYQAIHGQVFEYEVASINHLGRVYLKNGRYYNAGLQD